MSTHAIVLETGYKVASSNHRFTLLGPMSLDEARTRFEALAAGTDAALPPTKGAVVVRVGEYQFLRIASGLTGTKMDRVTWGPAQTQA